MAQIDIVEAMKRSLAGHFAAPWPNPIPGVGTPSEQVNGNIEIGWSDQRDRLVLPVIEIDAPIAGEDLGRMATVIAQQRIDANGDPTADLAEPNFLWTVAFGNADIALMVRVGANTKEQRAQIDYAIGLALRGDFANDSALAISPPSEYFGQQFVLDGSGSVRHVDSSTIVGRDEFTSLREITAQGCFMAQYTAAGFTDLSVSLKVVEGGRDFTLAVAESITIFDPTT